MANTRHDHRHVVVVAVVNRVLIFHRAAWLNDRDDARFIGNFDAIGEREKGFRSHHRTFDVETKMFRFFERVLQGIYAARLAATHCYQLTIFNDGYSVGFQMFNANIGVKQILNLLLRRAFCRERTR